MTDLEELIQYWKDNYSINYGQRSPLMNNHINKTIMYLTELNSLRKIQHLTTSQSKILQRRG